ncbi:BREX system P-loop protein BrxC [Flavobacterium caseinilyticum]|uniref:BREX system P-loop protein BrxC n=1 Tax=Flavobacterium caseinilyticum TaxID=2541732 RepID=A0A4R5B267_9FLAO|nr:BREX system P-loop protein BrxC [Flavobacterium caseinilyticum]TDD78560.1 BREX system P-loop protein BrxC [Flavobacterium caseinilyticum]
MITIKDILKLDLNEDIKNVIDLEDQSENEIQSELESYIVTDGLGEHLSTFIKQYTSNIKETGVWLSGFYGSGKSYFGKMLGYLIANPNINGTSARDRFMPRLAGVKNENFIKNDILSLDSIKSTVVFLDIAKQNTENGLAFTLFSNFLKKLGLRDDVYGYMEYDFLIEGKLDLIHEKANELFGKDWNELKKSNKEIAKAMRRIYMAMDYSEAEYEDTKNVYRDSILAFDSDQFKNELEKYIKKNPDQNIVFIFDETSEAISQGKFKIVDLQALSESLSSISKKVWTIAIAQEKLDNVIVNANINRSQLTKVTDRFKTKMHLESTEVDVIMKNRLLLKKDDAYADLVSYYKKNEGLISDATNLKSSFPTKTGTADQFATYYPFHKYQFDLLQKFLFSSNALVTTQVGARGMIITTFDVLKKGLADLELYKFTTAHDLCTQAQTAPPADLDNKYKNATRILDNENVAINGEKLLKTIHFINEAELIASPTIENITKCYNQEIEKYYDVKPFIEVALNLLVEAKILLVSNNNYKITSNLEGKLLEEMKDFDVELFIKKRELVNYLKKSNLFRPVATINDSSVAYNFNVLTDLEDEIISSNNKKLKLTAYSLFNINGEREDFIEALKLDTQYTKDAITLVPDNTSFNAIDKLLEEVKRYGFMEEKYSGTDDEKIKPIIREFSIIKDEKEKDLINLISDAYEEGALIYMFDENLLNKDNFKSTINEVQKKLIKNIYTQRLAAQLQESIGEKVVKEATADKLHRYFSGDEFKFFDTNGNFVGDHLKIVEQLRTKINTRYIDGKSLEEAFALDPWGYSYGTLSTTLAVLFRAGKLVIRTNDTDYFSYTDKPAQEVFVSGSKFKSASYKSISKTLSTQQKSDIINQLIGLEFEKHTNRKITDTSSDFDVADGVSVLAEQFVITVKTMENTVHDFNKSFKKCLEQKQALQAFISKTTEANYIEKAEDFLKEAANYAVAIKTIIKTENFVKKNLDKIKGFSSFTKSVEDELKKAHINNIIIASQTEDFEAAIHQDVIEKFGDIQNSAQAIKDEYYNLMSANAKIMATAYINLKGAIENAQSDLATNFPVELNRDNQNKLKSLLDNCSNKVSDDINLVYKIHCQNTKFSLSDILNYIDLVPTRETELQIAISNFIKEVPKQAEPGKPKQPKKVQFTIDKSVMTTKEYRAILAAQLQALAGIDNEEMIEVTVTQN